MSLLSSQPEHSFQGKTLPVLPASSAVHLDPHALYTTYISRTDGKERLAKRILSIAAEHSFESLLDLGAGEGTLTKMLAPSFTRVVAVERSPQYMESLNAINGVRAVLSKLEDFVSSEHFDLALMAYSLAGVPEQQLVRFLCDLNTILTPKGKALVCSYQEGCPWDLFTSQVAQELSMERFGGFARHQTDISRVGLKLVQLEVVETNIWGHSLKDLAETLAFFFRSKAGDYFADLPERSSRLAPFVKTLSDGRIALPVLEVLGELVFA